MLKNRSFWVVFGLAVCLSGGFAAFIYKIDSDQDKLYQECLSEQVNVSQDIARNECDWILD